MKRQLLCGVAAGALTLTASAAFAADMPVKAAAPAPGCIWAGTYIGTHMGYGRTKAPGTYFGDSLTQDFKNRPRGMLNGIQVGQNWCSNTFVYGWEADASFMNWRSRYTHQSSEADYVDINASLLASLRLRLGMTIDPTLMVYLTGGGGYISGKATLHDSEADGDVKSNMNKFGGVVGIGAEKALTRNVFLRLEGLYYFFDKQKLLDATATGNDFALTRLHDAWVARVGLSYKFGDPGGKAPVAEAPVYKAPAASAFNWSGFYVGGAAGGQASRIDLSSPGDPAAYRPTHDSVALGGHAGLQQQFGQIVLGVEGDYITGFGRETFGTHSIDIFIGGDAGTGEVKFKNAWSVGGRAGWSMGMWMPYVTVGWANGRFSYSDTDEFAATQSASAKTSGVYFGSGFEIALSSNVILGFEYRYYDFRKKDVVASDGQIIRFDPRTETLMARLTYKFGDWGKGPVMAKY